MEPRREDQPRPEEPRPEEKPKRFRIVKLEERIAPSAGGGSKNCKPISWKGCACATGGSGDPDSYIC
jgi:hypothetical protein